jgi:manganese/zinc/iron transport system permease protein
MLDALLADSGVVIVVTGMLVGTASSLLGAFLVLRRNSMLADAISHSIVLGIVLVWLLTRQQSGPVQLLGAALAGIATVALTELLARTRKVKDDAAIGLVFPALFALGVLLLNLYARDVHVDQHTVLLGEIGFVWLKTMPLLGHEVPQALVWLGLVTAINASFVFLLFKELKLATFDPALAHALGLAPGVLSYALLVLTSVTAVAAFEAVGVVLFVAFVIVPPAAAYLLTDRLERMILLGVAVALASSWLGYLVAVALDVSIGGMMAVVIGLFLVGACLAGPRYGVIARLVRQRRQRLRDECLALAVHLASEAEPSAPPRRAPAKRLGWSPMRAARVVAQSRRDGLVRDDQEGLRLTAKGRAAARAVLEPWRAGDG